MSQLELSLDYDKTLVPGSAKKAMSEVGASSRDLWQMERSDIHVLPNFNVRTKDADYHAHIRMLADSMKRHGFKQDKPLGGFVAKEDGRNVIYLHDGHCRLEAYDLAVSEGAQINRLPVVTAPAGTSLEDLTAGLVINNNGWDLKPFEKGVVCKRLTAYGWENERIAAELGLTEQYVDDLLLLMGSPRQIRDMVQANQVAATQAIEMLRKNGDRAVEMLEKGLDRAHKAGKTKVTSRFVPGAALKKVFTKNASTVMTALRDVRGDPAYTSLTAATRMKLDELLKVLDDAESEGDLTGGADPVGESKE